MAKVELIMPKMGESIMEATILNWTKSVGDTIDLDETVLEIATDKVDSEIPSPVVGVLSEILFEVDAVVPIGTVIAIIATEGESASPSASVSVTASPAAAQAAAVKAAVLPAASANVASSSNGVGDSKRFYSPLVKNIAASEGIALSELESVPGSGAKGRVTKKDMLAYVVNRSGAPTSSVAGPAVVKTVSAPKASTNVSTASSNVSATGNVEIIEMDRMRKLIADHMVMSKHTSPHVTSFVEADVTNLVNWRNSVKGEFIKNHGEKITFTPIFIEAVVKAIKDFPGVNASVDGTSIIMKKDINIGMAAALPSGNLIVPVIKNADTLNMVGLTKKVNDLAGRARTNNLSPNEIQGGTFTMTNVGTFGNVMGTPIINQPQVAILAVGAIRKKPAVVETEYGDVIAIRQMMFLSLSYDHRVVDGMLGGSFLKRIADYLEQFDVDQKI